MSVQDLQSEGLSLAGLDLSGRGRRPAPLTIHHTRALNEADLARLGEEHGALGVQTPALQRIRTSHHRVAQLKAQGHKDVEISAITGFSQSRLSILAKDPTFAELVQHYRTLSNTVIADLHERMLALSIDALEELHRRLDEEPDGVTNQQLTELFTRLADRTGFGPTSTQKNITYSLSANEIAQLKKEAQERSVGTVNVSPRQISETSKRPQENLQSGVGATVNIAPSNVAEESEAEGQSGERESV